MTDLERLLMSIELWGKEFEAAGRSGVSPGTATIEDGDLPLTLRRWASWISERTDPGNADDIGKALFRWLQTRYRVGQADAITPKNYETGKVVGRAEAEAQAAREGWLLPLLCLEDPAPAAEPVP